MLAVSIGLAITAARLRRIRQEQIERAREIRCEIQMILVRHDMTEHSLHKVEDMMRQLQAARSRPTKAMTEPEPRRSIWEHRLDNDE